jgi:TolA-binding protein
MKRVLSVLAVLALGPSCATVRSKPVQVVEFEPAVVKGDLALEKLNDEELFAQGESAYAAKEYGQAARYFDRLVDFHPESKHLRAAGYNAGLAHQQLQEWDDARERFAALADAARGQGDALDATFRLAESLYHLGKFDEAAGLLSTVADRLDLSWNKRLDAQVQRGVVELEARKLDQAEATLKKAMAWWQSLSDRDEVDDALPAMAQFHLGEIYRIHYEEFHVDPEKDIDEQAKEWELKAESLLSAQGHYLRAIKVGNGVWATASGQRIGGLYEDFYDQLIKFPVPKELNDEESEVYRQELRKKIRVLLTKAIEIYERTLETAERIGTKHALVDQARDSLQRMKELLVTNAQLDDQTPDPAPANPAPSNRGARGRVTPRRN